MIISRLDLQAFGRFTGSSLDLSAGPRRFHLVYGPNESGKSTSLRAISSLLYGMPHTTEDNYLHALPRMRVGGLLVDEQGKSLSCVRRRGRKGTLRDGEDDGVIDEQELAEMLGGVDRETFHSRFGLSHDELVAGGKAILSGDGDLGELLFAAGAGISQLRKVQAQLTDASKELFVERGKKQINLAIAEVDGLRRKLREAQLPPAEFRSLGDRIETLSANQRALDESIQQREIDLAREKAMRATLPLVPRWRDLQQSLRDTPEAPELDEAFTERRREAESERKLVSLQSDELQRRLTELRERQEAFADDPAVVLHEAEIETLFRELVARDDAERQRLELQREQEAADREITDWLRSLSIELSTEADDDQIDDKVHSLRISEALRARIEELSGQHETLMHQRDAAASATKVLRERIDELTDESDRIGAVADPAPLSTVIDSVGAPTGLLDDRQHLRDECDVLQQRCEELCRQLSGWDGGWEDAADLRLPGESEFDRGAEAIREASDALALAAKREQQIREELELSRQRMTQQENAQPLPTEASLRQSRQQRDRDADHLADLSRHGADVDDAIAALRESMRHADRLVDTIRTHHQEVHRRATDVASLKATEERLARAEADVSRLRVAVATAQSDWTAMWQSCGVKSEEPARMRRWVSDHERLIEQVSQWKTRCKRLAKAEARIDSETTKLRKAIATVAKSTSPVADAAYDRESLFDAPPADDLMTLHVEAVTLRDELSRAWQRRETLEAKRRELQEELPAAEANLQTQQERVKRWDSDWQQAISAFGEAEATTPAAVRAMVHRIDQLCQRKQKRDELVVQMRSIVEDTAAFQSRVSRVAEAVGEEAGKSAGVAAIVDRMYRRLQDERATIRQRESLREEVEQLNRRHSDLAEKRQGLEVVLGQLCGEAGCDSPDELPEIENRSRKRQSMQASLEELRERIVQQADGEPLESFIEQVSARNDAVLEGEIERQESELRRLNSERAETLQELGALRHQYDQMDGGAEASELSQSIQLVAGKINRDAEEYARLRVASLLLGRAIDHYREENANPVLEIAERLFARLTCGEYKGLKVDYDAKGKSVLFGVRDVEGDESSAAEVPAPAMSTGTADALYLAMRLASLQHQLSHGTPLPLVIDDCLIQLDDARCLAAMEVLSELSLQTQVILFTHHQHLIDLAQANLQPDHWHLHRLDRIASATTAD